MTDACVVVGLELTPADVHILDTALLFAKGLGASVHAVHALDVGDEPNLELLASSLAARAMAQKLEARLEHARAELERIRVERATFGVPLETALERGRPYEALLRAVDALGARARAVIAGAGRMQGTLSERLLGSTTDQLLRHTRTPVVVVPHAPGSADHAGGHTVSPHGGTWLVAVDGSEPCARALALATSWARAFGSHVALVHASSDRRARDTMSAWIAAHDDPSVRTLATEVTVIEDTPAHAILARAETLGASVVVLGTHGRKGIVRALLGSVAASVVRHAKVPVLCVP